MVVQVEEVVLFLDEGGRSKHKSVSDIKVAIKIATTKDVGHSFI